LNQTSRETLRRFRNGESIEEIARVRGFVASTIYGHLAEACSAGEEIELGRLLTPDEQKEMEEAFSRIGFSNLTGVYELLDRKFDYGLLRLYRSAAQRPKAANA
jgi:ATP-dependent DNA helicase RecQ